jgi:hypothetical protein
VQLKNLLSLLINLEYGIRHNLMISNTIIGSHWQCHSDMLRRREKETYKWPAIFLAIFVTLLVGWLFISTNGNQYNDPQVPNSIPSRTVPPKPEANRPNRRPSDSIDLIDLLHNRKRPNFNPDPEEDDMAPWNPDFPSSLQFYQGYKRGYPFLIDNPKNPPTREKVKVEFYPIITQEEYEINVTIPKTPTFVCNGMSICHFELTPQYYNKIGWTDVTNLWRTVQTALPMFPPSQTMLSNHSPSLLIAENYRTWCDHVVGTDLAEVCFLEAIRRGNSPLGKLNLIRSNGMEYWYQEMRDKYDIEFEIPSVIIDELLPIVYLGDKTGLHVTLLQKNKETQLVSHKYFPRTYYICTPCGTIPKVGTLGCGYDQWDLWINDYYDGNPPLDWLRDIPPEHSQFSSEDIWLQKQPSLDAGHNLWVIKATAQDPLTLRIKQEHKLSTHEGIWIHVVDSPESLLEVVEEDNSIIKNRGCLSPVRLIQKYAETVTLYQGRKADFRVFVGTLSLNPPVAYVYHDALPVRLSLKQFSFNTDQVNILLLLFNVVEKLMLHNFKIGCSCYESWFVWGTSKAKWH